MIRGFIAYGTCTAILAMVATYTGHRLFGVPANSFATVVYIDSVVVTSLLAVKLCFTRSEDL